MPGESSKHVAHHHHASPSPAVIKKRRRALETDNSDRQTSTNLHSLQAISPDGGRAGGSDQASQSSKRAKTQSSSRATVAMESPLSPAKMYSFPKAKSHAIDLTADSPTRKIQRKITVVEPQAGPRRLMIKNARPNKLDGGQKYFAGVRLKVEAALRAILDSQKEEPRLLLEDLYQGVKNACKQGHDEELRSLLENTMQSHARKVVGPRILEKLAGATSSEALRIVLQEWAMWKTQWRLIRSIFFYMDPTPVFTEMSINLFLGGVLKRDEKIMDALMSGAVDIIGAHRRGQPADSNLCLDGVNMTVELGLYTKTLEPLLFRESQSYFQSWAKQEVEISTLADYVRAVWNVFQMEMARCDLFQLSSSTRQELEHILETVTIKTQKDRLVETSDVQELLDEDAENDIKRLYQLLRRCSLALSLSDPFRLWVRKTGEKIVYDNSKENSMVIRLITLRKQSDRIWSSCFGRDGEFVIPMRKAFEYVMNMNRKSAATHNTDNTKQGEMIAKFVDRILRGETMTIPNTLHFAVTEEKDDADLDNEVEEDTESSLDDQLDQVLDIFRFLQGKAVFEEFYKQDLAKRLLMGRSASADAELGMLRRLKTECGEAFTQNLETMFKDIDLSREEMAEYKERQESSEGAASGVDLYVNVLSSSAWPSYPDVKVSVPPQVSRALHRFEESYKAHHGGRTLYWKHSLAHCQLKANFGKERKELVVSGFQAIVLLLFNGVDSDGHLTYREIATGSGLDEKDLSRTLQSLACAKLRPLKKTPQGRDVNKTDTFQINRNFSHPKYRVKINQVQLKETKEENKKTHEKVLADREYETQAAIIRVMKGEKTISHPELIRKVVELTIKRGVLPAAEIKKHIERLIEKEYMEREEGTNKYSYVA